MNKLKTISKVFALVCLFVLGVNFAAEARSHTSFGFSFGLGQSNFYPSTQVAYYQQPAPVYYQPAPVYYQPVPTYYQPVYSRPQPIVVYQQAPCAYPVRPAIENRASFHWSANRYR